jgi:predicted ATP-dependent serine protease
MVGRVGDRRALDDLVESVRRGLSGSLVIVGEPGIGKTRLLRYIAQAADGVRVMSIAGVESERRSPVSPRRARPTRRSQPSCS